MSHELVRYAGKSEYIIVGGFSKLLKYFTRNYEYTGIKTFADIRWSSLDSNLYNINGFVKKHISEPNYWYFQRDLVRHHRYSFRKNVLHEKLETFDPELTEVENMKNNNWSRIWDCGNLVYEMTKEKD